MKLTGVSYVILGAVRIRPRSGYEIKRLVDNATRYFWAASYGQLYPELARLRDAGLLAVSEQPRGRRRRNVYSLTDAGHEAFEDWLRGETVVYELRDEGLLKLFFASAVGRDEEIDLVRRLRRQRESILERLREIERRAGDRGVVLDYGIRIHECAVSWCDETEKRLTRPRHGKEAGR